MLTDADSLLQYGRDWTRAYTPDAGAVVLPANIDQVQDIVRLAAREQLAIVPSGGRTGLSAGAVARNGELVLALDRLNQIDDFNPVDRTVRCGAGVITEQLQQYAEERELFYPVDFASSGSSQIGGNISTNAGGIKVIRHGMTRDWVAGLKLVTGTANCWTSIGAGQKTMQAMTCASWCRCRGHTGRGSGSHHVAVAPAAESCGAGAGCARHGVHHGGACRLSGRDELSAFEFFSELALCKVVEHQGLQRPFDTPPNITPCWNSNSRMSRPWNRPWRCLSTAWSRAGCWMA